MGGVGGPAGPLEFHISVGVADCSMLDPVLELCTGLQASRVAQSLMEVKQQSTFTMVTSIRDESRRLCAFDSLLIYQEQCNIVKQGTISWQWTIVVRKIRSDLLMIL